MKVLLTAAAEADLEEIADWIGQDNPRRAVSFVLDLRDCCEGLGEHPLRFQKVPRYEARQIRRRVHGAHVIFYRVDESAVVVLRIVHGARDYEPLIFPDEAGR